MQTEYKMPIYEQIALDIAVRIARGELKEGDKINGRSLLAGEYKVSPETIRRAMSLLSTGGIVTVQGGSGIKILSRSKAMGYAKRSEGSKSMLSLKKEIEQLIIERQRMDERIMDNIDKMVDYSERLKNSNPIYPMEFEVPKGSHLIGCQAKDLKFWQNTGGTIVGVRRGKNIEISPGPYAEFQEGDVILVVGDNEILGKIKNYINKQV